MKKIFETVFLSEKIILFIVVINTVTIFLTESGLVNPSLALIDFACTTFFLLEMVYKQMRYGFFPYWRKPINIMDGVLVLVSIPSLLMYVTDWDLSDLSFLLALRSLRIFRVFRIKRLFPEFDVIVRNLKLALQRSWAFLLALLLLILIFALIDCGLYARIAPEYFATPLDAIYSTFRLFTVEGWYEIPDTIAAALGSEFWAHATRVYFCFQLFVGGIIGMSLINSIFVDAMVSDNNDELDSKVEEIRKILEQMQATLAAQGIKQNQIQSDAYCGEDNASDPNQTEEDSK